MNASLRTSVYVDGLDHGRQPIPNACRVGDILWSGGVSGIDRATQRVPEDVADEVAALFANIAAIAEAGGTEIGQIVRVTVFVRRRDEELISAINHEWLAMFPDPQCRPARHLQVAEIHEALRVQCEFIGVGVRSGAST